jgi:hypothetical protein
MLKKMRKRLHSQHYSDHKRHVDQRMLENIMKKVDLIESYQPTEQSEAES